jgi:hypothetical protein
VFPNGFLISRGPKINDYVNLPAALKFIIFELVIFEEQTQNPINYKMIFFNHFVIMFF